MSDVGIICGSCKGSCEGYFDESDAGVCRGSYDGSSGDSCNGSEVGIATALAMALANVGVTDQLAFMRVRGTDQK